MNKNSLQSQRSSSPGRIFARSWLFSTLTAELAFIIVWLVLNPVAEPGLLAGMIFLPFLFILGGMLPVILLLLLGAILLRRFAPGILASPLPASIALMVTGGFIAAGEVMLLLDGLRVESELVQVVMLAGIVGGIVAGWVMAGWIMPRRT